MVKLERILLALRALKAVRRLAKKVVMNSFPLHLEELEIVVGCKVRQWVGLLEIRFTFYLLDTSVLDQRRSRKMFPTNMILSF
jgi:hypothetical protein